MQRKFLKSASLFAFVVMVLFIGAQPALATHIDSAKATVKCDGTYSLTVAGGGLNEEETFTVVYSITLTPISGPATTVTGSIPVDGDQFTELFSATVTGSLGVPFSSGATLSGTAQLFSSVDGAHNQVAIDFTYPTDLDCGTGGGKSFKIGPSSMEGDLAHIMPGDWISGGYSFKFVDKNHGATSYTVNSSITLPVYCPDGGGPGGNIIIPLGTQVLAIPAGDTNWQRTGDQNNILSWEGAVQAPNLCGGNRMRNQVGATFNNTVSQSPQVGLVDWRFHYRDPASKGKPNTNCTDGTDPNRARADVCGASWSQTFRDP